MTNRDFFIQVYLLSFKANTNSGIAAKEAFAAVKALNEVI